MNLFLKIKNIAFGGTNFVNLSIKDIMSEPIKLKASKIILVHNHPSGDSKPSKIDYDFTYKVMNIANDLDIQLLDHIVIGNNNYTSIISKLE